MFTRNFSIRTLDQARKLIGKEIVLEAKVKSSAVGERSQVVLGKVVDVYRGTDGNPGLKMHNYRRTAQALTNTSIEVNDDGQAIRSYSGRNIKVLRVLTGRGISNAF